MKQAEEYSSSGQPIISSQTTCRGRVPLCHVLENPTYASFSARFLSRADYF